MNSTKEQIRRMIDGYRVMKEELAMKEYELKTHQGVTDDEIIRTLALRRAPFGSTVGYGKGTTADRTAVVALVFREYIQRVNGEDGRKAIEYEMESLKYAIRWIESQVARIRDPHIKEAVTDIMRGVPVYEIAGRLKVGERTIHYYRRRAVEIIASAWDRERPELPVVGE
jgi:hypothetical protein